MRTTVDLKPEHRSRLLALAAKRGEKGFSSVVGEAVESYLGSEAERERRRQSAIRLRGSLKRGDGPPPRTHCALANELAMIVADTDVLIDYLEGRDPEAEAISQMLLRDQLQTTAVNYFELRSGARRRREREAVLALLESIPVLPLDVNAARRAAEVRQGLERSGIGIGMGDSLIAGIVLAHGASLLTRNRRHFERVPELLLADVRSG